MMRERGSGRKVGAVAAESKAARRRARPDAGAVAPRSLLFRPYVALDYALLWIATRSRLARLASGAASSTNVTRHRQRGAGKGPLPQERLGRLLGRLLGRWVSWLDVSRVERQHAAEPQLRGLVLSSRCGLRARRGVAQCRAAPCAASVAVSSLA
eukprot:scaffold705_cov402-Prasinococcus_capsulatus_cf.AAC.44